MGGGVIICYRGCRVALRKNGSEWKPAPCDSCCRCKMTKRPIEVGSMIKFHRVFRDEYGGHPISLFELEEDSGFYYPSRIRAYASDFVPVRK